MIMEIFQRKRYQNKNRIGVGGRDISVCRKHKNSLSRWQFSWNIIVAYTDLWPSNSSLCEWTLCFFSFCFLYSFFLCTKSINFTLGKISMLLSFAEKKNWWVTSVDCFFRNLPVLYSQCVNIQHFIPFHKNQQFTQNMLVFFLNWTKKKKKCVP